MNVRIGWKRKPIFVKKIAKMYQSLAMAIAYPTMYSIVMVIAKKQMKLQSTLVKISVNLFRFLAMDGAHNPQSITAEIIVVLAMKQTSGCVEIFV